MIVAVKDWEAIKVEPSLSVKVDGLKSPFTIAIVTGVDMETVAPLKDSPSDASVK